MSMPLATPKRPVLPPTPSVGKPSLPPLSTILSSTPYPGKLPSFDSLDWSTKSPSKRVGPVHRSLSSSESHSPTSTTSEVPLAVSEKSTKSSNSKAFAFISHSPATYPSQEPSIDNAPLARRKRRRTSPNELAILNREFQSGSTPNKLRRLEIANMVSMTEKAVQIWFQNKRQALRKQSAVEKEVTELPVTPVPVKIAPRSFASTPIKSEPVSHTYPATVSPAPSSNTSVVSSEASSRFYTTPNSSFIQNDDSFDNSIGLVLNETKKRQPSSLNGATATTMTFKLGPARPSTANILANIDDDDLPRKRKPLGQLDVNLPSKFKKESDGAIESLLHLKSGKWGQKVNV
ncbi:Homeobox protein YOX1 [Meyerozyma sp. JA9]|nr:Homeobox protein YOX1 [Meyerozyma sp. JA9]